MTAVAQAIESPLTFRGSERGYSLLQREAVAAGVETWSAVSQEAFGIQRPVEIKLPMQGHAAEERLLREALAYSRLRHASVRVLLDVIDRAGSIALVLDAVSGVRLDAFLASCSYSQTRLTSAIAAYLSFRLFDVIAAAHAARDSMTREFSPIVHGDLRAASILLEWDGEVKLLDFESAWVTGAGPLPRERAPAAAETVAPERRRLDRPASVRTDVFAAASIARALFTTAADSALPRPVAVGLQCALGANPDARTVTAADLAELMTMSFDVMAGRRQLVEQLAELRAQRPSGMRVTRSDTVPRGSQASATQPPPPLIPAPPALPSFPPGAESAASSPWAASRGATKRQPEPPSTVGAIRSAIVGGTLAGVATAAFAIVFSGLQVRKAPEAITSRAPRAHVVLVARPPLVSPVRARDAQAPTTASEVGEILTPREEAGHRLFVDGRFAGAAGAPVVVRCGTRAVRVGSAGRLRVVDVPCGGSVLVAR